jgi:aspartyl-tRNA(Asn)/glutamyl-tRNA(Gln) amidotransferase subunit C
MARSDENSAPQFTIAPDEVRTTAELARLYLEPEEVARTAGELSRILEYAAKLRQVDVEGVEPTVHAVPQDSPLREDTVCPQDDLAAALGNAPLSQDRYFVVPAIFEHGDEG